MSTAVIVLPIMLRRFEPAEILCWQVMASFVALIQMVDFGMAPTFARLVAYARAEHKAEHLASPGDQFLKVLATQKWVYQRLALIAFLLSAIVGTAAVHSTISRSEDPFSMWGAWTCVVFISAIQIWVGYCGSVLQGIERIAELRRAEAFSGVLQVLLSILFITLFKSVALVVLAGQIGVVVGAVLVRRLLYKYLPDARIKATKNQAVMGELWPSAWRSGVGVLMSQGIINVSGIMYAQLTPAATLVPYLFAMRITSIISQFSQAPFYTKIPEMARLHKSGEGAVVYEIASGSMRRSIMLYIAGMFVLGIFGQDIFRLIGAKVSFVSEQTWVLLTFGFYFERVSSMYLQYHSISNKVIWHISNGLTGGVMILLSYMMYTKLSIDAFPMALLFAYAFVNLPIGIYSTQKAYGLGLIRHLKLMEGLALLILMSICMILLNGGL
jgi:hypothetical protein